MLGACGRGSLPVRPGVRFTSGMVAMNMEEFEDLVDRLGEDLSLWPEPVRAEARLLLAQSEEAREVLAEARSVRLALSRDLAVRAPAHLVDRIMHQARLDSARPLATTPAPSLFAFWLDSLVSAFRPAILLPLCFMIGVVIGLLPLSNPTSGSEIELPSLFQGCCADRSAY